MKKDYCLLTRCQIYGSQYSLEAKHCIDRTAHTGNLIRRAETKAYSLFDSRGTERVLNSFYKAWDAFEEMNENGISFNFKMDFLEEASSILKSTIEPSTRTSVIIIITIYVLYTLPVTQYSMSS